MPLNLPKSSWNSVAEYQVSGTPFVTASAANEVPVNSGTPIEIKFSHVTQWFTVINTGTSVLRVGFTALGVQNAGGDGPYNITGSGGRYTTVQSPLSGTSPTFHVRCNKIFIVGNDGSETGSFEVVSSLTSVPSSEFPILTGSDTLQGIG